MVLDNNVNSAGLYEGKQKLFSPGYFSQIRNVVV